MMQLRHNKKRQAVPIHCCFNYTEVSKQDYIKPLISCGRHPLYERALPAKGVPIALSRVRPAHTKRHVCANIMGILVAIIVGL